RKNQHKIDLSNLVSVIPSADQILSPESLLPSVQSPLSFTYENPTNSNLPMTKRIGRIRIQRCIDGQTGTNSTIRLITSGETNTRLSLPTQPTIQASSILTTLITARRSNSLNNSTSNPSNC
ncbi:unnamed protein product, partial [Adineta steineri]